MAKYSKNGKPLGRPRKPPTQKPKKAAKPQGFAMRPDLINRKGRPRKGESFTEYLKDFGSQLHYEYAGEIYEGKKALALMTWNIAMDDTHVDQLRAIQIIYNRVDGKPAVTIKQETENTIIIKKPKLPGKVVHTPGENS